MPTSFGNPSAEKQAAPEGLSLLPDGSMAGVADLADVAGATSATHLPSLTKINSQVKSLANGEQQIVAPSACCRLLEGCAQKGAIAGDKISKTGPQKTDPKTLCHCQTAAASSMWQG